jgi:hypothetical protein
MKKIFPSLLILSLLFVGQAVVLADTGMQDGNYKHTFTLDSAVFHVSQDEREVHYTLNGASNTLMCHGGYTVATLSGSSGVLNQSHLTNDAFKCNPNIQTVSHLVQAMREGKIHLGTHTSNPTTTLNTGTSTDMMYTYKITVENLTSSQILSPGVFAAHNDQAYLWHDGMKASEGIRLIAEEGKPDVAYNEVMGKAGIDGVIKTDMPIHRHGGPGPTMTTYELNTSGKADRLSSAQMLVCTNDGFTGVNSVMLPYNVNDTVSYTVNGYDAGTELNDEQWQNIADPCGEAGPVMHPVMDGNGRVATDENIMHHQGIKGTADLTSAHNWGNPVAKITVQRVK